MATFATHHDMMKPQFTLPSFSFNPLNAVNDGLRLALIVGSLSFVFLAGQLAHSRTELSESAQHQIVSAVQTVSVTPKAHHKTTATERYAQTQIQTMSEVLDGLTERAEVIFNTTRVSNTESAQLKSALQALDADLMTARASLAKVEHKADRFNQEDLRESLMALQESAARAQGQVITLDQPAQAFKVSRIGQ